MNIKHKLLMSSTFLVAAYAPGEAGWKLTADGKAIELKDGNPIYINADGTEATMAGDTITRLNSEAAAHRRAKETAEAALIAFKDIKDPAAAIKALDDMKKIDQKKLIDAGEVDKVKDEITRQYTEQLNAAKASNSELQTNLNNMKIGNIFSNSEFVRDQIAVPLDMFKDSFSKHFKVNDKGEIEAFDRAGNRMGSKTKIGDYASPEEALQLLVEQHPQKDTILKPVSKGGTGGNSNGGARGGGNVMKRAAFDALPMHEQQSVGQRMAKGEITLTD